MAKIKVLKMLLSVASALVIAMSSVVYVFADTTNECSGSVVMKGYVILPDDYNSGSGGSGSGGSVSVTVPVTENIKVGSYVDSSTNKRYVGSPTDGEIIAVFSNENTVGSKVSIAISGYTMAKTSGSGVILSTRSSFTSSMKIKYLTLRLLTSNTAQPSGNIDSEFFDSSTNYTSTGMSSVGTVTWSNVKQLGTMEPSGGNNTEVGFAFGGVVNNYCTTWTSSDTLTVNIIYDIIPVA